MRDDLLFHDLAALAARVEDEAQRCQRVAYHPGSDAATARAAGLAYAKLDTLEHLMFEATNSICHQASELGLDASPAKRWMETKVACRRARRQAHQSASRLVSEGAVTG